MSGSSLHNSAETRCCKNTIFVLLSEKQNKTWSLQFSTPNNKNDSNLGLWANLVAGFSILLVHISKLCYWEPWAKSKLQSLNCWLCHGVTGLLTTLGIIRRSCYLLSTAVLPTPGSGELVPGDQMKSWSRSRSPREFSMTHPCPVTD